MHDQIFTVQDMFYTENVAAEPASSIFAPTAMLDNHMVINWTHPAH